MTVDGAVTGAVDHGLLLLVGIAGTDGEKELRWMVNKIPTLRIFRDDDGRMNRSLSDVEGGILAVSQFTLYGNARKGRRPSFIEAAAPDVAKPLFDRFVTLLREQVDSVETGVFGAMMQVELVNDGPVTLILEI